MQATTPDPAVDAQSATYPDREIPKQPGDRLDDRLPA
jgi:hypothetical protein